MMRKTATRSAAATTAALLVATMISGPASAAVTITHGIATSWDQTPIAFTLFLPDTATADAPAPVIFNTHGWGLRRTRDNSGMVKTLTDAGYAVFTWDQRGFGDSGGEAQSDSQEYEVRDVQTLLDLVANDTDLTGGRIELDGPNDPRVGMVGGSYAGGIQLMTASVDARIDAIAPQIAWNDLPQALRPNGVLKLGWDLALYGSGLASAAADGLDSPAGPQTGAYAEEIHQSFIEGVRDNDWSAETLAWFDARSPKHYISGITAPTLLLQGVNDTLFPINHAIANAAGISAPTKMVFFCGLLVGSAQASHSISGNTSCTLDQSTYQATQILNWFARYLRNENVSTGAAIDVQFNKETTYTPLADLTATSYSASTSPVPLTITGSESHVTGSPNPTAGVITFGTLPEGARIVGVPRASFRIGSVAGTEATMFVRLVQVDQTTGVRRVLDDQVTPYKVAFPAGESSVDVEFDLNGVVWRLEPGTVLTAEISGLSADHAVTREPGVFRVSGTVTVPVL